MKAKLIHARLVREGKYKEARMLLRAMINKKKYIIMGLHDDTAWSLSHYFGKNNGYAFKINI